MGFWLPKRMEEASILFVRLHCFYYCLFKLWLFLEPYIILIRQGSTMFVLGNFQWSCNEHWLFLRHMLKTFHKQVFSLFCIYIICCDVVVDRICWRFSGLCNSSFLSPPVSFWGQILTISCGRHKCMLPFSNGWIPDSGTKKWASSSTVLGQNGQNLSCVGCNLQGLMDQLCPYNTIQYNTIWF